MSAIKEIERQLKAWGLSPAERVPARVMLGVAVFGPSIKKVARGRGIARADAAEWMSKMREAGILKGRTLHADWCGEDGGIAFCCDLLTVMGLLNRVPWEALDLNDVRLDRVVVR